MEVQGTDGILGLLILVLSVALKYGYKYLSAYLDERLELLKYEKKQKMIMDIVDQTVGFVEEYSRASAAFSGGKDIMTSAQKRAMGLRILKDDLKDKLADEVSDDKLSKLLYSGLNRMRK